MARRHPRRHPYTGANLRHYREQNHLSLRDLGERSGIAYTQIGKVERGESELTYETACKLADALAIPVQLIWDHIPASIAADRDRS
jgi:transcriptional regulator with XRE-family HTH domain